MSLAFADPRFLLSTPARTAAVAPGADEWRPLLERAGLEETTAPPADVLLAGANDRLKDARDASAVILEGSARVDGYAAQRYVVFGQRNRPILLVPRDRENVLAYALSTWSSPRTRARRLRSDLAAHLPQLAVRLAGWPTVTLAARRKGPPYVVAAAMEHLGHRSPVDWFLVCGQSDDLGRAAFLVFPQDESRPRWLVKFARVPGYSEPFEREERAFAAVAAAGGAAAGHAPSFHGRFEASGLAASVESAAAGRRLSSLLRMAGSRSAKLRMVDAVADWLVTVGIETRRPGAEDELERLRRDVLPAWPGVSAGVLSGLSELPLVLQHNDVGTWNLVGDGRSDFTAVDWESANPAGLPLWDLWYFLADALRFLDGEGGDPRKSFVQLFRGEKQASSELFRWTRVAVDALAVPAEAVGKLATLCWLHHGRSQASRGAAIDRYAPGGGTSAPPAAAYAEAWLGEPTLGTGWRRWMDD